MKSRSYPLPRAAALAVAAALAIATLPHSALAQGVVGGAGDQQIVTGSATVKSIDLATRHVVLVGANGDTFSVKVGPEVQRLDQVKPGDTIKATYQLETVYVLSRPNTTLPADTETTIAARAAKGELPAAVVANHTVVTGAVIGVDMTNHTLKLVDPDGGQVHTVKVRPQNQAQMASVKVGDKITAYVTESLLLAVDRP